MNGEETCKCGWNISRGHGYYNYNQPVKCWRCGRINKRGKIETPKELLKKFK